MDSGLRIKVCGMRDDENIRQVAALGVDYIGMIFWDKSPRYVTMVPTRAGIIPDRSSLAAGTTGSRPGRVGVFVDEMPQNIITRAVGFQLDVLQLHGHESPTIIRNLRATLDPDLRPGLQVWKTISVSNADDIRRCADYEECVDAFVFDTSSPGMGGSGRRFDWRLLDGYQGRRPFMLSGGIGPDDAERVAAFRHPRLMGIDLNSRFESAPALKDVALLERFIAAVRSAGGLRREEMPR